MCNCTVYSLPSSSHVQKSGEIWLVLDPTLTIAGVKGMHAKCNSSSFQSLYFLYPKEETRVFFKKCQKFAFHMPNFTACESNHKSIFGILTKINSVCIYLCKKVVKLFFGALLYC